jgi:hypothetical protein
MATGGPDPTVGRSVRARTPGSGHCLGTGWSLWCPSRLLGWTVGAQRAHARYLAAMRWSGGFAMRYWFYESSRKLSRVHLSRTLSWRGPCLYLEVTARSELRVDGMVRGGKIKYITTVYRVINLRGSSVVGRNRMGAKFELICQDVC